MSSASRHRNLIRAIRWGRDVVNGLLHSDYSPLNRKRLFSAHTQNWLPMRQWIDETDPLSVLLGIGGAPNPDVLKMLTGDDKKIYAMDVRNVVDPYYRKYAATMYSGKMRKVAAKCIGQRFACPFSPVASQTHGLWTPDTAIAGHLQQRWVIEISSAGVFAWPVRFGFDTKRAFAYRPVPVDELTALEAERFDFLLRKTYKIPTAVTTDPTKASAKTKLRLHGPLTEVYQGSPLFNECGWAFSESGQLASNIFQTSRQGEGDHIISVMSLWTVSITAGDVNGKRLPVAATVNKVSSGDYWSYDDTPNIKVPNYAEGLQFSIDANTTHGFGYYPCGNTPVYVYYSGEVPVVVTYTYTHSNVAGGPFDERVWTAGVAYDGSPADGSCWPFTPSVESWSGHAFGTRGGYPQTVGGFSSPALSPNVSWSRSESFQRYEEMGGTTVVVPLNQYGISWTIDLGACSPLYNTIHLPSGGITNHGVFIDPITVVNMRAISASGLEENINGYSVIIPFYEREALYHYHYTRTGQVNSGSWSPASGNKASAEAVFTDGGFIDVYGNIGNYPADRKTSPITMSWNYNVLDGGGGGGAWNEDTRVEAGTLYYVVGTAATIVSTPEPPTSGGVNPYLDTTHNVFFPNPIVMVATNGVFQFGYYAMRYNLLSGERVTSTGYPTAGVGTDMFWMGDETMPDH